MNNREIVLEAVRKNGDSLRYASRELQADREVVLQAVKQNVHALRHANEALLRSKSFVSEVVQISGDAVRRAMIARGRATIKRDDKLARKARQQHGFVLKFAAKALQSPSS